MKPPPTTCGVPVNGKVLDPALELSAPGLEIPLMVVLS